LATFEFYVDDDRYSVPSLHLMDAADIDEARALAEALLEGSPHHLGIEVRCGDEQLFAIGATSLR
jgi:hypothetical protein